ncbi:hypothetical protein SDRG_16735 [Saprolegnia diclina VS20]|uniref:Uncharacterized protein n=1 Tax=Saprolegnia diclina (strain VS20) TaxID=1156394 RepID=T0R0B3_SAPDV|nr:hypothetical protein SDRG_16735 [Saprolegnia diclina VS20]EQC25408.1 hypothetical protein SDRG_16735 [Saprolegnia diclina VS20]|eukprot:XP_008621175.1 hypothetical protein SDRG_16735 [Saprolegnia diclina VS20]
MVAATMAPNPQEAPPMMLSQETKEKEGPVRRQVSLSVVQRVVQAANGVKQLGLFASLLAPNALPTNRVWAAANAGDDMLVLQHLAGLPNDATQLRPVLEYTNRHGQTPLIAACAKGHIRCVQALLMHSANVYAQDNQGHTGLHHACLHGHFDLVGVLLSVQDPALRNREGLSAMDVCRRNIDGHRQVLASAKCLELLEQRSRLFEGWLYESVNNLASSALGLRSLQSWVRRYAVVFSVGSPDFVEIACFDVQHGLRQLTPQSTILFRVHDPVVLNSQRKMFNPKPYNFTIAGSRKMPGGYLGRPDLFELAAFNAAEYERWASFMCVAARAMTAHGAQHTAPPRGPSPSDPLYTKSA